MSKICRKVLLKLRGPSSQGEGSKEQRPPLRVAVFTIRSAHGGSLYGRLHRMALLRGDRGSFQRQRLYRRRSVRADISAASWPGRPSSSSLHSHCVGRETLSQQQERKDTHQRYAKC